MERNPSPASDDLRELAPEGGSNPAELRFECGSVGNGEESREDANGREGIPDPRVSLLAGANEARYKSMSPARLPIARAPCLTIPPGLSPSALLGPPVLLPDVKGPFGLIQEKQQPCIQSQCQSQGQNKLTDNYELAPPVPPTVSSVEASPVRASPPPGELSDELQQTEHSENRTQMTQSDCRESNQFNKLEKSAEDGYNWRKYGQKHVKGSEFPRSYYKCTHPNCEMKRQIERSHDGQIAGIIYKGCHDHPKPAPNRRMPVGATFPSEDEEQTDNLSSFISAENESEMAPSKSHQVGPNFSTELSPASIREYDAETGGDQLNNADEFVGDDRMESKRRKMEIAVNDVASLGKMNHEPRVVVQTVSEIDILDDGYRWRKYGQKIVKGNPNPRSYYKCTSVGCPVRKHVERASHDPKAVITTYEGKHNHDVPAIKPTSNEASSSHVTNGACLLTVPSSAFLKGFTRPFPLPSADMKSDTISLDLGVSISPNRSNLSYETHTKETDQIQHHQSESGAIGGPAIRATSQSNTNGISYARIYESGEGFAARTAPLNASSEMHYSATRNTVMGP
ncbi:WRKY transcription factor SUSIBA2-like [Zingiber officinale]|uniref:WRKY domain-containing protein n=1 Tax=Zingiber officinale TaxID=94328 RepID=A0A8J5H9V1_ZINOF|nr:WRKY transcription factor SUSIBA2-like [Zingiber officinale]KAG6514704.1 hypothetical protein ZIOFF_025074 [Zingiber officinale]